MPQIILTLLILTLGALTFNKYLSPHISWSRCQKPLQYQVDFIDPRFKVSLKSFLKDAQEAAKIWNQVYGQNLIVYDEKASLKVNLVFDERQNLVNQISQIEQQLQSGEKSLVPKIAEYESKLGYFKQKLATLNSEIDSWNTQGGAPSDVYARLIREQEELKKEAESLNSLANSLNLSAQTYNINISKLNKTIDAFNEVLEGKPEEGLFDPDSNKILIYFSTNREELIHTITHEFGHALGLDHLLNKEAIMYSFSNQNIQATRADIEAIEKLCRPFTIPETIQYNSLDFYKSFMSTMDLR